MGITFGDYLIDSGYYDPEEEAMPPEINDRDIVSRKIESLTPPIVRQWLSERLANCHRIAAGKTGTDREGWLEDAAYFSAAMGMIEWTELERLEPR